MKYRTISAGGTKYLAARFAKTLRGGEVIALQGELGSGKTTFVQGLARALGVRRLVKSPTFTLVQTFPIQTIASPERVGTKQSQRRSKIAAFRPRSGLATVKWLCHVDAYRLDTPSYSPSGRGRMSIQELGLDAYVGQPDTVTVIEWPERIRAVLPQKTIWIHFAHGKKENERVLAVKKKATR